MNQNRRSGYFYHPALLLLLCLLGVGGCRRGTLTGAQSLDAANAVRQLDRVRVAVFIKATHNEYDLALNTAQNAVTEKLPALPEGSLKQEIVAALTSYQDAGKLWAAQDASVLVTSSAGKPQPSPGVSDKATVAPVASAGELESLAGKYDLKRRLAQAAPEAAPSVQTGVMPAPRNDPEAGRNSAKAEPSRTLPPELADPSARVLIWQTAEEHLNKAKELLTKENRIF